MSVFVKVEEFNGMNKDKKYLIIQEM